MMRRTVGALLLALALPAWAQPLLLVSEEEVARERAAAPSAIVARSAPQPGAPTIKVLAPLLGNEPLGNPIRIELVSPPSPTPRSTRPRSGPSTAPCASTSRIASWPASRSSEPG
jgi:hypothetical protein